MKSYLFLALFVSFFSSSFSYSGSMETVFERTLQSRDQLLVKMQNNDLQNMKLQAVNLVARNGIKALREEGHSTEANKMEKEFESSMNTYFAIQDMGGFSVMDLGDHDPLLKFLARLYDSVEKRLGSKFIRQGIIGDIYEMNYAIPVVMTPVRGKWRAKNDKDWVEYRRHFIPFSSILTYYATLYTCKYYASVYDYSQKLCSSASKILRQVMSKSLAPVISDFIFFKSNKIQSQWKVTRKDVVYTNASDLIRDSKKVEGMY